MTRFEEATTGSGRTVSVGDSPPYLGAPTVVAALLFAVDHEGAYRPLPVRDRHECGVIIPGALSPSVTSLSVSLHSTWVACSCWHTRMSPFVS